MTGTERPRIELTRPDLALHADWLAAAAEFTAIGQYQHGSGLTPDDEEPHPGSAAWRPAELAAPERFAAFVSHLRSLATEDVVRPLGMVPDDKLWITCRGARLNRYVGALSLRHELNDHLRAEGGHIGYAVRPSAQGRGVATQVLGLALDRARGLGIDRVLLACEQTNPASARVIEKWGGVLEDVRGLMRRYWIDLADPR